MASVHQERQPQQPSRSNLVASLARDLTSVASLGILLLCIHEFGTPFMRGFQCDDETIRYPYKESTVSSGVCYLVGSGVNVILILVVEYANLVASNKSNRANTIDQIGVSHETSANEFQVKVYLQNVYCRMLVWFFGAISCELITDITKVTAGRLRPHFIEVCQPIIIDKNVEMNITQYCQQTGHLYEYIMKYYCSGNPSKQRDARLSFLSGHSSYSAYSAIFAVLYIQSSVDITKVGMFKPAIQVLVAAAAFYTGLTRVSDYKHHWQDVLAGFILGTTIAILVSHCLWPSLYRTYSRLARGSSQRRISELSGEELNRFSY